MTQRLWIVVEGVTDVPVAERLAAHVGFDARRVIVANGKGNLDKALPRYDRAARAFAWLVLRDLDHDAPCAPALVERLLPRRARRMCLRIAVRSSESWLLADAARLARALQVDRAALPPDPDALDDPKRFLVGLAGTSPSAAIRADLVPDPDGYAKLGRGHVRFVTDFALRHWRPDVAAKRSESLRRCLAALRELAAR